MPHRGAAGENLLSISASALLSASRSGSTGPVLEAAPSELLEAPGPLRERSAEISRKPAVCTGGGAGGRWPAARSASISAAALLDNCPAELVLCSCFAPGGRFGRPFRLIASGLEAKPPLPVVFMLRPHYRPFLMAVNLF